MASRWGSVEVGGGWVAVDPTRAVCGCATLFLQIKDPFTDGNFLSMTGYAVILQPQFRLF